VLERRDEAASTSAEVSNMAFICGSLTFLMSARRWSISSRSLRCMF
jgi:hypothetical protein